MLQLKHDLLVNNHLRMVSDWKRLVDPKCRDSCVIPSLQDLPSRSRAVDTVNRAVC
jgi:hypothetical protein